MSSLHKKTPLHKLVAVPVAVILLAAFIISGAAVMENLRFIRATDQILWLVSLMRSIAGQQKGFAQNPGEDVWGDLSGAGQIDAAASHANPWHGDVRAVTVANMAMRIESDLPSHDCSRLALYFLGRQPVELGLLQIEAQPVGEAGWAVIYPQTGLAYGTAADIACGHALYARLALIFKIR